MRIFSSFWRYLAQNQPLFLRVLHIGIALLVVLQIINSNDMHFTPDQQIRADWLIQLCTWMHIVSGILLLPLIALLLWYCFKTRGFRYFYPYLWGDTEQLTADLRVLFQFQLPESQPKGVATCIQGLGLGALVLVVLSGLAWFVLWCSGSVWTLDLKSLHKTLTSLIEAYVVGHGGMALLHFIGWCRRQPK
ncbi:MAG: cytochrome b/b6 domain-containing protein [Plesiomonas sp.]|uniref:cytochrome b/b6 domain-containing protein n=1 Tax=Plesiomonas sp. TaxID=2486279 RepID=UPI003F3E8BCF